MQKQIILNPKNASGNYNSVVWTPKFPIPMGEFKQTTQKFHRILRSVTLLCSHQIIFFEPIM
jgi:hypothetical protein